MKDFVLQIIAVLVAGILVGFLIGADSALYTNSNARECHSK